jgi:hypothetical protein
MPLIVCRRLFSITILKLLIVLYRPFKVDARPLSSPVQGRSPLEWPSVSCRMQGWLESSPILLTLSEIQGFGPLSECGETQYLRESWHFGTAKSPKILTCTCNLFILGHLYAMVGVRCRRLWDSKENPEHRRTALHNGTALPSPAVISPFAISILGPMSESGLLGRSTKGQTVPKR